MRSPVQLLLGASITLVLAIPLATTAFALAAAGEGCANEQVRGESNIDPVTGSPFSTQLPECRAYEQVTPQHKSANALITGFDVGHSSIEQISPNGDPLVARSAPIWGSAGQDAIDNETEYELAREPLGWTVASLSPPSSEFTIATETFASPTDAAEAVWYGDTPSSPLNSVDLYRRQPDGFFEPIGPIAPPATTTGHSRGHERLERPEPLRGSFVSQASNDLSRVVFQVKAGPPGQPSFLWPGDGTIANDNDSSLYEYVGAGHTGEGADVPSLVGRDNSGAQISQCGTEFAAEHHAVSEQGSTILFYANAQEGECTVGPLVRQLYARIGTPGADQTTVSVAGSSACEASSSCNVSEAVTFQGAADDGSKAYFTTTQPLTGEDQDSTNDIYLCELPGDGGPPPPPIGVVNACPHLRDITATGSPAGAEVQEVIRISEDGSHVYFTAAGVLTTTPDDEGQTAQPGAHNLYVWEAPSATAPAGRTTFIATLPEEGPEASQVNPSGTSFVFTTSADLTSDDTSTVSQVFRFDTQDDRLQRISVGQNGFADDGNTDAYPAKIAIARLGRLTQSYDGSYIVFQSSAALIPSVQGGTNNVYLWHQGTISLISDGTDSTENAGLIGIDASGQDIFFTTADRLVGQDTDEDTDLYDARIGGGFPAPPVTPACVAEECQGSPTTPPTVPAPASTRPPLTGNLTPPKQAIAPVARVAITKHSVKGSTITLSVKVTGAGSISAAGSGLKTLKKGVTKAGTYTLKLTLTEAGKASLRKHHKLKVKLKVSFTPSSGAASSATITITVKR